MIKHRTTGPTLTRDIGAVLAAIGEDLTDLVEANRRFQLWIAGPNPTPADRLRAAAAIECLGAALALRSDEQVDETEIRSVLLEAGLAVLAS